MKKFHFSTVLILCLTFAIISCEKSEPNEELLLQSNTTFSYEISPSTHKLVSQLRQATVQYHDTSVAIDSGYVNTEECVSNPNGDGAMGVHFVKFSAIDDHFDPLEPEVLVYEIKNNGSYKLVALEYLFIGEEAPSFNDEIDFHHFEPPFADFELHVWAWKANPNGIFEDFNPNVSCPD